MAPRKPTNKRAPRRRVMRKRNRKARQMKVSQMITHNSFSPKPQVFRKVNLYNNNLGQVLTGTGASATLIGGAIPSSMPDWSSVIALYNRYKMLKVTYTFNIQPVPGSGATLYSLDLPKILIRYNYDSNLASGSIITKLQEVPNAKQFQFTPDKTTFSYTYYPRCTEPVYLSSVLSGYKLARQQYIDVQYGTVPHYGIMAYIDNLATGLQLTFDVQYETAFKYQA